MSWPYRPVGPVVVRSARTGAWERRPAAIDRPATMLWERRLAAIGQSPCGQDSYALYRGQIWAHIYPRQIHIGQIGLSPCFGWRPPCKRARHLVRLMACLHPATRRTCIGERHVSEAEDLYCTIRRAFTGCTGRLLAWCIVWVNFSIWAADAVSKYFITIHQTPSLHGGVVREPLKR